MSFLRSTNVLAGLALIAFVGGLSIPTAAQAGSASVEAVTKACDRTPGCGYTVSGDGSITGCSVKSNTCFDCPNDGKRMCNSVMRLNGAALRPTNSGNLGVSVH